MSSVLLTRHVDVDRDGTATTEPLYLALQMAKRAERQAAIIDALPRDIALEAIAELHRDGKRYGLQVPWRSQLLEDLGPEAGAWAIVQADAYPPVPPDHGAYLKQYVFRALVRSKVPIKREWEHLYPNVTGASVELLVECAAGLSDERRPIVLAQHFPAMQAAAQIVAAFPTPEMVTALLSSVGIETAYGAALLNEMKRLGARFPAVHDAIAAVLASGPEPLDLRVSSIRQPESADELSPIAQQQLRKAGMGYDQQDLDAAARLAKTSEETSFYGTFQIRTVSDADGTPRYEVLSYLAGDAGAIYEAGSTNEIGTLSQGGVVLIETNEPLRAALQEAVRARTTKQPK